MPRLVTSRFNKQATPSLLHHVFFTSTSNKNVSVNQFQSNFWNMQAIPFNKMFQISNFLEWSKKEFLKNIICPIFS